MSIIQCILQSILLCIYQYFWPAVLLSILILIASNYAHFKEPRDMLKEIYEQLIEQKESRNRAIFKFFLSFFLMRFLLGRGINLKPLNDILNGWNLINEDGRFNTQPLENVIVFAPLIYMMFICYGNKMLKSLNISSILKKSFLLSFVISLSIEICQVIFVLGCFQIVDIIANTFGGVLGGVFFWFYKIHNKDENS